MTKSLRKATLWASWVGRIIGWVLIAIGILSLLSGRGFVGGIWLAFIGWFISAAAAQSYAKVVVDDVLNGIPVARLMRTHFSDIPEGTPIAEAVSQWFMHSEDRTFPVTRGDMFIGVASVDNLGKVEEAAWPTTDITAIMKPAHEVPACAPADRVIDALAAMSRLGFSELPVLDGGRLVGLLEQRDVTRWIEIRMGQRLVPRRV